MNIIFQSNIHGHRAEYVYHLARRYTERGEDFIVWIRQSSPEDAGKFSRFSNIQKLVTGDFSLAKLQALESEYHIQSIIFLDGDTEFRSIASIVMRFSRIKVRALMMRLSFPFDAKLRSLFKWFLKICITYLLNCHPNVSMRKLVFLEKSKLIALHQVRDPLPMEAERFEVRETRCGGDYQLAIVGTIDPRKNVDLAIKSLENLGKGFNLTLAGEVTPGFKMRLWQLLDKHNDVRVTDEHLTDAELNREVFSADCILVLQSVNAPSGTMLRALSIGTPIVVAGARVLRKASKRYPRNVVWTKLDATNLASAVIATQGMSRKPIEGLPSPEDFAKDLIG